MKKRQLADAMTIVIARLKQEGKKPIYDWNHHSTCNVGLLSRALSGDSSLAMTLEVESYATWVKKEGLLPTWSNIARSCSLFAMPKPRSLQILEDFGLSDADIAHLENLSDPVIRKKAGIKPASKVSRAFTKMLAKIFGKKWLAEKIRIAKKKNFIKYLVAWQNILLEEKIDKDDFADEYWQSDKKEIPDSIPAVSVN